MEREVFALTWLLFWLTDVFGVVVERAESGTAVRFARSAWTGGVARGGEAGAGAGCQGKGLGVWESVGGW